MMEIKHKINYSPEIMHKFRGISELDGRWVYGDLVHDPSLNELYIQSFEMSENGKMQKIMTQVKPDSIFKIY